jgi:ketosteroid isomerase-like protein
MADANVENLTAMLSTWADRNLCEFDQAWQRGEVDLDLMDAQVAYEDTILPDHVGETYRGHEGVVRAMRRWVEPFDDLRVSLERIVGEGDTLVSIHLAHATAAHTHLQFDNSLAYLWRFREGCVATFCSYWEPADALRLVGLDDPHRSGGG